MAKKQIVSYSYTCDVCGDPIPNSAGDEATRKVSWEGTEYVVDVCETHSSQLVDLLLHLNVFVGAGRRSGGLRGRAAATTSRAPRQSVASDGTKPSAPKRGDLGAIRSWAQANGRKVGDRGRIPAAVTQAYEAANATWAGPSQSVEGRPAPPIPTQPTSKTAAKRAAKKRAPEIPTKRTRKAIASPPVKKKGAGGRQSAATGD